MLPNTLKPIGVFPMGNRTMALYADRFKEKDYLVLGEVQAVVDPADATKVIGWRPAFKGGKLQAAPDAMKALLRAAAKVVSA